MNKTDDQSNYTNSFKLQYNARLQAVKARLDQREGAFGQVVANEAAREPGTKHQVGGMPCKKYLSSVITDRLAEMSHNPRLSLAWSRQLRWHWNVLRCV